MLSGNGIAGAGSSINNTADSNSTGLLIKSGYNRGGVVTNIQYSNSCFQDHKAEIVFNPNYENTTGTASPNLENILMQNLTFLTAGTVQLTGTSNGVVFPLGLTLDNVGFPSTFPASEFSPAPTNAAVIYGPGQVSSNFIADYTTFVPANGNTATNNITETTLNPPQCNFTYIAPELTGPNGVPQTITAGQDATVVVLLTPAVGGAAYPTGTVTFTYTTTGTGIPQATTATLLASSTPNTSVATAGVDLPIGTDNVTATYAANGSFAGSFSSPLAFTVTQGTILALPSNPIPLPYTMTTLAGGASANCSTKTDSFGDGCPATSFIFGGSVDLRSVTADHRLRNRFPSQRNTKATQTTSPLPQV